MKQYNTNIFTNNDANSYYLLGLFITDGNLYDGEVSLCSIDHELLVKINDLLSKDNLIFKKTNSNCYRLRIHNKVIYDWFMQNECVPNKTKIVKFPNVPKKYLPDFIRGLIDGDGSIGLYGKKSCVRFDSASFELISSLNDVLKGLGIDNKISLTKWIETEINGNLVKSTTQMYRIALNGLKAYKLLKYIYYPGVSLFLDRKKEISYKIYSYIERNGFAETELFKMDRLPVSKWSSEELLSLCIKYKGVFKLVAKELNVSATTIANRLKMMGKYDFVRQQFPYNNIENLKLQRR